MHWKPSFECGTPRLLVCCSHGSSQASARVQSTVLRSTIANVSEIKDLKSADKQKESDSEDRRPLGICITGLPARSSGEADCVVSSLCVV